MNQKRLPKPQTPQAAKPGTSSYSSPACYLHELESGPSEIDVRVKRIYSAPSSEDGVRVLVDRLWPRGVRREYGCASEWLPEVAPSVALRRWFGHDPQRWTQFRRRYLAELKSNPAPVQKLRDQALQRRVTLLYAARDPKCNHAVVLRDALYGATVTER